MKVIFITNYSASSVKGWSGIPYYAFRKVRQLFRECISLETPLLDSIINKLRTLVLCIGIDILREDLIVRLYGAILGPRIDRMNPDAVIAIASSQKIGRLKIKAPIIYISDATFRAMVEYYPGSFSNLTKRTIKMGDALERSVLHNCAVAALSSRWAADSAVKDYGVLPNKVRLLPFGANIDGDPEIGGDARSVEDKIVLLFVGVVWERKGGPLAFRVLLELLRRGIPAELHIVGCEPAAAVKGCPGIVCHGFLNKSDPAERNRLAAMFQNASFLIVPSRQEAYGLVFAEASAYGLPILATNTGGIPTVVEHGVNGFLFGLDVSETAYVDTILELRAAPEKYKKLRDSSRDRYVHHLSWNAWGERMGEIVAEVLTCRI
jgi:glycosyltransferase involved in cell wall biosynthesis